MNRKSLHHEKNVVSSTSLNENGNRKRNLGLIMKLSGTNILSYRTDTESYMMVVHKLVHQHYRILILQSILSLS